MPEEARAFLMKQVEILDNALINYQLQGFGAITAGFERLVGHAVLNQDAVKRWKQDSPEPFKKVLALIGAYVLLMNAATGTIKLLERLDIIGHSSTTQSQIEDGEQQQE